MLLVAIAFCLLVGCGHNAEDVGITDDKVAPITDNKVAPSTGDKVTPSIADASQSMKRLLLRVAAMSSSERHTWHATLKERANPENIGVAHSNNSVDLALERTVLAVEKLKGHKDRLPETFGDVTMRIGYADDS